MFHQTIRSAQVKAVCLEASGSDAASVTAREAPLVRLASHKQTSTLLQIYCSISFPAISCRFPIGYFSFKPSEVNRALCLKWQRKFAEDKQGSIVQGASIGAVRRLLPPGSAVRASSAGRRSARPIVHEGQGCPRAIEILRRSAAVRLAPLRPQRNKK